MVQVLLEDNNELPRKLREFREKVIRSGIMDEVHKRKHYLKPSLAKKAKIALTHKRRARARRMRYNRNEW